MDSSFRILSEFLLSESRLTFDVPASEFTIRSRCGTPNLISEPIGMRGYCSGSLEDCALDNAQLRANTVMTIMERHILGLVEIEMLNISLNLNQYIFRILQAHSFHKDTVGVTHRSMRIF
jgi:hypothetical protein